MTASGTLGTIAAAVDGLRRRLARVVAGRRALHDQHRRYRDLFESVPDGYLITGADGVIRVANAAACELFGEPPGRVVGTPLADYVHADDRGAFGTQLSRLRDAPAGGHLAINLTVRDHEVIPANLTGTHAARTTDDPGEITWLIRDRRHDLATEALRASEERLRALFETAEVGIMLCDTSAEILFANSYADSVLDRGRGDTAPSGWLRTTHPDDLTRVEETVRAACEHGVAGALRHRVVHTDGTERWIDHSIAPFYESDGSVSGVVCTLTDVTAEHTATDELRSHLGFTGALLDTVSALVVVTDPDGRIVRFNTMCEAVTGFAACDVIGQSLVDTLVPPEERDSVDEVLAGLSSLAMNSFENNWVTKDGRRRRISWTNATVTDPDGNVTAIISTGIDITDQRILESRLAQMDRLDSVGRLVAGIAHDFNNTLAVLRLRLDRLAGRDLDADGRSDVEAAVDMIERTKTLIADLLSFSTRQDLAPVPIDVNTEVRRVIDALSRLLPSTVETEIELADSDTSVVIDPTRFEQALTNLAINARDAMPDGGTLRVATRVATIRMSAAASVDSPPRLAPGTYVVVSLTDTGVGIAPDDLPHVFDPYFTTKPPGRGTGLGLATTYGTLAQSGGTIMVDSTAGDGTTFELWIPAAPSATGAARPTAPRSSSAQVAPATTGARTVLVVDDDDDVRNALVDGLESLGYHTIAASDGGQAIGFASDAIDVLVTDIQLPDIDGGELATRFRRHRPDLPIVYVSGLPESKLRSSIPDDAVLLLKPFGTDDLVAAFDAER